jgi:hypothetical protein
MHQRVITLWHAVMYLKKVDKWASLYYTVGVEWVTANG